VASAEQSYGKMIALIINGCGLKREDTTIIK
jgi:hypothetical protein